MTDATSTTQADSYGLVVPQQWVEIPVDDEGFDRYSRDLRRQLAALDGWNKTAERRLDLLFSQLRNDIAVGNVRMAAVWAQAIEDLNGEPGIMIAGVALSKLVAAELTPNVPSVSTDRLMVSLSQPSSAADGERIVDLEAPARIVLAHAGEAVRLKRMYERELSVLDTLRYYAQSYLVPHDDGAAICVVQFTTLNVEEASLLDELFEAIAQSLRIFGPDDPTDFGESLLVEDGA